MVEVSEVQVSELSVCDRSEELDASVLDEYLILDPLLIRIGLLTLFD